MEKTHILVAVTTVALTTAALLYLYFRKKTPKLPLVTQEQLKKLQDQGADVFQMYGLAYDVTEYGDHPGGLDVFEDVIGTDATEAFEDEGHSQIAIKESEQWCIGRIAS